MELIDTKIRGRDYCLCTCLHVCLAGLELTGHKYAVNGEILGTVVSTAIAPNSLHALLNISACASHKPSCKCPSFRLHAGRKSLFIVAIHGKAWMAGFEAICMSLVAG